MNKFQIIMVGVMIITGTLNTISATLQLARPAKNSLGEKVYFEHYYVQTLFMMLGETMCFGAYFFMKYVINRKNPSAIDGDAKDMNPLILLPAALMDIVATSLGYIGLGFMKDAGFFQMLRVTPIIFCGLLSIPILKQRLKWFNWTGILLVCTGLIIKAIPRVMDSVDPNPDKAYHHGCIESLVNDTNINQYSAMSAMYGLNQPYYTPLTLEEEEASGQSCDSTCQKLIGIAFVIVGEFFHGVQFVYEQKYIVAYDIHPLKAVGYEGTFGVLTLCIVLWPMYFITLSKDGMLGGIALGPAIPNADGSGFYGRFEDAIDAFRQIFDGDNGGWLLAWTFGNMCSIAVFNYAGITVAKELNATTRAVLDQVRVILIWAVFLIPWGTYLCRVQDYFHYTAAIGFVILICGVWVYNDVIIMPAIRKYILKQEPEKKTEEVE